MNTLLRHRHGDAEPRLCPLPMPGCRCGHKIEHKIANRALSLCHDHYHQVNDRQGHWWQSAQVIHPAPSASGHPHSDPHTVCLKPHSH